ncbi:hypothetical protein HDV00_005465 [Rhizophlyctis rosea]|nr:hypothetical protein HDV00_005465 [Rhizophlyctis rosea]
MGVCQSTEEPSSPTPTPSPTFKYDTSGRRLHAEITPLSSDTVPTDKLYILPNDDEEMDRLHLQHYIMRLLFGGNFSAPVKEALRKPGAKVVDLGCGSGIWAMETATEFPQTTITALDMSPVQPTTVKPKNLTFTTGDLTSLPLPFADNTFDFVYMRFLVAGLRAEHWPLLINEMVRITKPGGWIEMMEPKDMAMTGETVLPNLMRISLASRACDTHIASHLPHLLSSHPQLTHTQSLPLPLHTRPDPSDAHAARLAKLYREDLRAGFAGLKSQVVGMGVCSDEHYGDLVREHIKETVERGHTVWWVRCWAQKKEV